MSEVSDIPPELQELRDLVPFLDHENPEVRKQSLQLLSSFNEDSHVKFIVSLGIIKPSIALIADRNAEVSSAALNLLINLSAESEDARSQIITAGGVNSAVEFLIQAVNVRSPQLALMLLINLTTDEAGIRALMQDGKSFEGLHVTRLVRWFADPALRGGDNSADGVADEWAYAGDILANLSQLLSFRALLTDPKKKLLLSLKPQFSSEDVRRRVALHRIVHNLANDLDQHAFILDPEAGLWPAVLAPVVGHDADGCLDEDELAPMYPEFQVMFANPRKRADAEGDIRTLAYETVMVLVRNAPTRTYLRARNTYQLLREAHKHERAVEHERNDQLIDEDLIPFFILDEDAPSRASQEAQAAEAMEVLRRQAKGLSLAEAEAEAKAQREAAAEAALSPMLAQMGLAPGADADNGRPQAAVAEMDEDEEFEMAARYNDALKK